MSGDPPLLIGGGGGQTPSNRRHFYENTQSGCDGGSGRGVNLHHPHPQLGGGRVLPSPIPPPSLPAPALYQAARSGDTKVLVALLNSPARPLTHSPAFEPLTTDFSDHLHLRILGENLWCQICSVKSIKKLPILRTKMNKYLPPWDAGTLFRTVQLVIPTVVTLLCSVQLVGHFSLRDSTGFPCAALFFLSPYFGTSSPSSVLLNSPSPAVVPF